MSEKNKNNPMEDGSKDGERESVDIEINGKSDIPTEPTDGERADNEDLAKDSKSSESARISSLLEENDTEITSKRPRRVTLSTLVCTCIAAVLAAVMLTYTVCSSVYQSKLADAKLENVTSATTTAGYSELDLLAALFESYSFLELDEEALKTAVLKAYVEATGDKYAEYYTNEEYKALTAEMAGESQGIGINIINSTVEINGVEYKALKVINVIKDSPACAAEVKFGDFIIAAGQYYSESNVAGGGQYTTISELGYDMGLKQLQGLKNTVAEFVVYRPSDEKMIDFSILRDEFTTTSVMYQVVDSDVSEKTGIVKIINFDLTTPDQLEEAIEDLRAKQCDKFVFDVRYNPGGELSSIVACLSYFLEEGDTVISMKDNDGNETVTTVGVVSNTGGCSVSAEDIGKYKDLNMIVLCNESTASAAELFVANFRDHGLGEIVGTTTYGKGSVQTYINLAYFGYSGVLKLTRYKYYPPNGEGYDGIGIDPTETVELSDEASGYSIYDIMGKKTDNQLVAAVKYFNN